MTQAFQISFFMSFVRTQIVAFTQEEEEEKGRRKRRNKMSGKKRNEVRVGNKKGDGEGSLANLMMFDMSYLS